MFGYIRPLECELRVREQAEYRGTYCGLCKSIGIRYGQIERLTLSYDCAFLALVLALGLVWSVVGQGGLQRASERAASHAIEGAGAVDGIRDLVLF